MPELAALVEPCQIKLLDAHSVFVMEPWQAIYDEYPSRRLELCVMHGEDRSTPMVLSTIEDDDAELLNSNIEFEHRMVEARHEAAFRNALDEGDEISAFFDANPKKSTT